MIDSMLKYQCPACTGPMHFDTMKQKVVCDYCGTEYSESYFDTEQTVAQTNYANETLENQSGFMCTSCGAEVVFDGNTVATECMYCGNPIILTDSISGMVKPDVVLPFRIDKQKAEQLLKAFYNKKVLLPRAFKDKNRIRKIAGMYVPFWLFSGRGEGSLYMDGTTSTTRREGDYKITTTKHYDIRRAGTVCFEGIPVDASRKMEDSYMDGLEPFDYTELRDFSASYMVGFFADKFDVSADECRKRAKVRVVHSTKEAMRDTITDYSSLSEISCDIELISEDVRYAMLPVWMLNTKYEGKMYNFAINGQTGKVSGDLPIDQMKKRMLQIALTIVCYIPLAIIAYIIVS